jgi:cytidylate kinase
MIITIDGPAGAGKSTAAKALARRLGFEFLDTGAMYRAVTLAGLQARIDLQDQSAVANLLPSLQIEMTGGRVLLNGVDVTTGVRALGVTSASGAIASNPHVRDYLVAMQRVTAAGRDMVCEGRDQGTVVFPNALCKFFLVADPVERARRRQADIVQRGETVSFDEILKAQQVRDQRDVSRDIAPMVPAPDAILIDSTHLTLDQVVERMEHEVRSRMR